MARTDNIMAHITLASVVFGLPRSDGIVLTLLYSGVFQSVICTWGPTLDLKSGDLTFICGPPTPMCRSQTETPGDKQG